MNKRCVNKRKVNNGVSRGDCQKKKKEKEQMRERRRAHTKVRTAHVVVYYLFSPTLFLLGVAMFRRMAVCFGLVGQKICQRWL